MSLIGKTGAGLIFQIDADSSGVNRELAAVDASMSSLGGKMSTFGGAASVAAAGLAAIGTAALSAGKFLFDLTVTSAEFGAKIFDASEKTGLATETLSAMAFAADQSGTSLESVTNATAKFSKAVATAGEDAKKSAEFLKDFGVSPQDAMNDLDGALGKVFTRIVNAREGVEQMALAQKAFGKSGAELLPFLKSFDGNLVELTRKAKDLGVTLSKEDAKAADDFGDTLDTLSAQAAGVGRAFTGPLMRDITLAMTDISGALAKNQQSVKDWGESLASTLRGLKNVSTELFDFAQTPAGRFLSFIFFGGAIMLNRTLQNYGGAPPPQGGAPIPNLIPGYNPLNPKPKAGPTTYDDPDEVKKAADARKKALADQAKEREEWAKRASAADLSILGRQLDQQLDAYRKFYKNVDAEDPLRVSETGNDIGVVRRASDDYLPSAGMQASIEETLKRIEAAEDAAFLRTKRLEQEITDHKQKQAARRAKIYEENAELEEKVDEERVEKADQLREEDAEKAKKSNADTLADAKAVSDRLLSDFEVLLARKLISEQAYNEAVGKIKLRQLELEMALTDDAREKFRIEQQIKTLRNELSIQGIELAEQELEAANAVTEAIRQQNLEWENLFALVDEDISPFQTIIDGWNGVIAAISESAPGLGETIGMISNAFSGMASAVGDVVNQYVLYGSTAPGIMRKILAAALASIAAEAAVRAVYALAMGFFFLATGRYVDATNSFISAAIFGSIAVGSALAGRAVAGGSFKQQASTATTSGGGSGGGSNASPSETRYTTEFGGYGTGQNPLHALIKQQTAVLGQLEETNHQLNRKIMSMSPGDVVAMGASDASRDIRQAYESELQGSVAATDRLMRGTGLAR